MTAPTTSYTDTGCNILVSTNPTTLNCYYAVKAVNVAGSGAFSTVASALATGLP